MSFHFPLSVLNALGGSPLEVAVIFLAILMLFGAKSLPGALRTLGRWSEQLRRVSRELQREIAEAGDPVREVRNEFDEASNALRVEQTGNGFASRPVAAIDSEASNGQEDDDHAD